MVEGRNSKVRLFISVFLCLFHPSFDFIAGRYSIGLGPRFFPEEVRKSYEFRSRGERRRLVDIYRRRPRSDFRLLLCYVSVEYQSVSFSLLACQSGSYPCHILHKAAHERGYFSSFRVKGEVSGIEEMNLRLGDVLTVSLSLARIEDGVKRAPRH